MLRTWWNATGGTDADARYEEDRTIVGSRGRRGAHAVGGPRPGAGATGGTGSFQGSDDGNLQADNQPSARPPPAWLHRFWRHMCHYDAGISQERTSWLLRRP